MSTQKFRYWLSGEDDILRKLYPTVKAIEIAILIGRSSRSVISRANNLGIKKDKAFMRECSKAGQFRKGHEPMNKGKKWDDYLSKEKQEIVRRTSFKKGNMPHNHLPVGAEIVDGDGYWKVKVAEPNKWKFKHRMLWEEHHGKLPKGSIVYFKDGNRDNITLENLAVTDRVGHSKRTIANLPLEVKQLIQLKGALKRQINKVGDRNENDSRTNE